MNTENDLLPPAQPKTKHDSGGGRVTGVSGGVAQVVAKVICSGEGGSGGMHFT